MALTRTVALSEIITDSKAANCSILAIRGLFDRYRTATAILTNMEVKTPNRPERRRALILAYFVFLIWMPALGQSKPGSANYSGMYSFLRDGEFVQVTVEDQGHVIGFVSRYAVPEGEGGFVNQFFKSGSISSSQLAFSTETVNGVSFDFRGTIDRGDGANQSDEGYYIIKGTLTETTSDKSKKTSSTTSEVALKSFPKDAAPAPAQKK